MGWDEKLFRFVYKKLEFVLKKRTEDSTEQQAKMLLSDVRDRLTLLAGIVSGEKIDVREAETVGGFVGSMVLMPSQVAIASDCEINWKIYFHRLIYSLCSRELGLALDPHKSVEIIEQNLLTVLAVPMVERQMEELFPNIKSLRSDVYAAERNKRIKLVSVTTRAETLEAFVQCRLGQDLNGFKSHTSPITEKWLEQCLQSTVASIEDLESASAKFLKGLRALPMGKDKEKISPVVSWGLLMNALNPVRDNIASLASEIPKESLATGTEKKAKAKEKVEEVKLNKNELGDNPIVHSFEKLHTADEYKGGNKSRDGEDSLEEHAEALEELDLRQIVRTQDRANSIYKADVMMDVAVGDLIQSESTVAEFNYDEWDEKNRLYKKNWCSVFVERKKIDVFPAEIQIYIENALKRNSQQVTKLKQEFEKLQFVRRWKTRQPDGPEIDLDAVIDRYATLKSGHSPSTKLYLMRRRQERDIATLILLDSSLSTDSWVKNRRVLDVAKESILVLGEVAFNVSDKIAIGAFHSNTRRNCRFIEVKKFDESWRPARNRLVALRPEGYTRIGPAIRHATFLMSKTPAKKKLVLLISDGKPTDFDRYEGRYGVADVRQAIREGKKANVHIKALAIDAQAKYYLPQMFGPGNYQILPRPELLATSLAHIYGQLLR